MLGSRTFYQNNTDKQGKLHFFNPGDRRKRGIPHFASLINLKAIISMEYEYDVFNDNWLMTKTSVSSASINQNEPVETLQQESSPV